MKWIYFGEVDILLLRLGIGERQPGWKGMETSDTNALSDRDSARRVSVEFRKCYPRWKRDGLFQRYLSGDRILDIGYRGGDPNAVPITEKATGIELDYPGYDGTHLPFEEGSQDALFASAVLEHISNYRDVLAEWYRVLKIGGYIIVFVPHRYIYERRPDLPSRWNGDHRRFYTSASLLAEFEESLPRNGFRVRHLLEDDQGFRYTDPPQAPPHGNYQIEIVVQKIAPPEYSCTLKHPAILRAAIEAIDRAIVLSVAHAVQFPESSAPICDLVRLFRYFTPWHKLEAHFVYSDPPELGGRRLSRAELIEIIRPFLDRVDVDVSSYLARYLQLSSHRNPALHWRTHGYFEGRLGTYFDFQTQLDESTSPAGAPSPILRISRMEQ